MATSVTNDTYERPLEISGMRVLPEHIDFNGHMNVGYYNVLFDQALEHILEPFGLAADYVEKEKASTFVLETHVCYLREVVEGDELRFTFQLLDRDEKRIHYIMQMFHADQGYLSATSEQVLLHVDMEARRAAPFNKKHQRLFDAMMAGHGHLPVPPQVNRSIGLVKKR